MRIPSQVELSLRIFDKCQDYPHPENNLFVLQKRLKITQIIPPSLSVLAPVGTVQISSLERAFSGLVTSPLLCMADSHYP